MKTLKLNDQSQIPVLGLGTSKLFDSQAVAQALEIGYRHIDTADLYGNHEQIAQGVKNSRVPREEIFLVTKIPAEDLSSKAVFEKTDRYLQELETDYLDLLLIHWPNRKFEISETLEAMNKLKETQKIKAYGVSNFTIHHLQDALDAGFEVPINQVEMHIKFNQKELKDFCDTQGIALTAYSPIGKGDDLLNDQIIQIADKYFASPAQVCLAWLRAQGVVAIPKASSKEHLQQNWDSQKLELSEDDMKAINEISQGSRLIAGAWQDFDY